MSKKDSKLETDLRENEKIIEQLNIRATVNLDLQSLDKKYFRITIWNANIGKMKWQKCEKRIQN